MSSQHPRQHTLPDGLFRGLSSFRELEARIARLPEPLERGDALEIFVEAYLWLTNIWQVQDLWLVGQIPLAVRTTLNLPSDHKGVDGAFRTRTGTLVPYQVKHRIGRPKVGVAEVATFLGLTERATDRVLISNATRYATDIENRDHLRFITGTDFDTLTAIELQGIANWLDGRPAPPTRYPPKPHQTRALTDIAATLTTHPRATVVMACATGKTLVALWATEQQHPATVLVLVPSLVLLKQLLGEWSQQTQWGDRFEYLCVCSDDTVTRDDAIRLRTTEVPFPVDTDPAVVRRFLDRPSTGSVRVVFSTYHSSTVVAEGIRGLSPFDVGIFDEAHKTTGESDATFALALDDARLPIRKRLFFTATPRHVNIRKRDREGDFAVVSMDDPAVYGPRALGVGTADVALVEQTGEEALGHVLRVRCCESRAAHKGVERVPVGLAQHGERLLRRRRVLGPGGIDHAPARRPEMWVAYPHAPIVGDAPMVIAGCALATALPRLCRSRSSPSSWSAADVVLARISETGHEMTHWIRFGHAGSIGFGTLINDTIAVHEGNMFDAPTATGVALRVDQVAPLAPTAAGKMLALWNNSRAMAAKSNQAIPPEPLYFIKANGSYLGTRGTIRKPPSYDGKVVFEGELGIVIGKECRAVSEAETKKCIFGYTCINDVTAIGIVGKDTSFQQWTRAKSFDTFGVFGPVVATGLDPAGLSIRTVLNDQERQLYPVSDLIFQPTQIVRAISQDMTLHPGDVICCGTSVGVGSMKHSNTVEVTIDGIGTLRNRYED